MAALPDNQTKNMNWIDSIGQLGTTVGDVFSSFKGTKQTTPTAPAPSAAAQDKALISGYLPWILGGLAVFLVGFLMLRKS